MTGFACPEGVIIIEPLCNLSYFQAVQQPVCNAVVVAEERDEAGRDAYDRRPCFPHLQRPQGRDSIGKNISLIFDSRLLYTDDVLGYSDTVKRYMVTATLF